MAKPVEEEIAIQASLAEVWDLYFEPRTWQSWVDEFRGVDSSEGYPEVRGKLVWHSGPNGRGQVSEEVLEHEPRRLHRIGFKDPESEGELTTSFEIEGEGTKVSLELVYGLFKPGIFGPITDRLFIRPQQQISLRRSLERFKAEAESPL
jgi:uncharacterized protein YndB with AHSA1/START domain